MPASNSSDGAPQPAVTPAGAADRLAPLLAAQPAPATGRIRSLEEARRALRIPTSGTADVLRAWGVPNDQLVAFAVSDDNQPDLVAEFACLLVLHRESSRLVSGRHGAPLRLSEKGNALWLVYGSVIQAVDRALVIGNLSLGPAFDLQAGDAGNDAALGVTAELLRLISPSKLLGETVAYLHRVRHWIEVTAGPDRAQDSAPAVTATPPREIGRARRSPVSDDLLAEMAIRYITLTRRGQRHPLPQLAQEFGITRSQARDRIHRARQKGWLAPGSERRAGGEPGPRLTERGWKPPDFHTNANTETRNKPSPSSEDET